MHPLLSPDESRGLVKEIFDLCDELGASHEYISALQRNLAAHGTTDILMLRACRDSLLQHRSHTLQVLRKIDARERVVNCVAHFMKAAETSYEASFGEDLDATNRTLSPTECVGSGKEPNGTSVLNESKASSPKSFLRSNSSINTSKVITAAQRIEVDAIYDSLGQCTASVEDALMNWEQSRQQLWRTSAGDEHAGGLNDKVFRWKGMNYIEKMHSDVAQLTAVREAWLEKFSPEAIEAKETERQEKQESVEKKKATEKHDAALSIQRAYRKHRKYLIDEYFRLKTRAAKVIQKFYRQIVAKQTAEEQRRINLLVAHVQAVWRGVIARKKTKILRKQHDAARSIQLFWRAKHLRSLASVAIAIKKEQQSAVNTISGFFKSALFRSRFRKVVRRKKAAVTLQRWVRKTILIKCAAAVWQSIRSDKRDQAEDSNAELHRSTSHRHRGLGIALEAILDTSIGALKKQESPTADDVEGAQEEHEGEQPARETLLWTPEGVIVVPLKDGADAFASRKRLVRGRKGHGSPSQQSGSFSPPPRGQEGSPLSLGKASPITDSFNIPSTSSFDVPAPTLPDSTTGKVVVVQSQSQPSPALRLGQPISSVQSIPYEASNKRIARVLPVSAEKAKLVFDMSDLRPGSSRSSRYPRKPAVGTEDDTSAIMENNYWQGDYDAAVKIQQAFRDHRERARMERLRVVAEIERVERMQQEHLTACVLLVQSCIRSFVSRAFVGRTPASQDSAARRLQIWFRRRRPQRNDSHRHEMELEFRALQASQVADLRRRKAAANRIGKWYHRIRHRYRLAATVISKHWKRYVTQRAYRWRLVELRDTAEAQAQRMKEKRDELCQRMQLEAILLIQLALQRQKIRFVLEKLEAQCQATLRLRMDRWSAARRIQCCWRRSHSRHILFLRRREMIERKETSERQQLFDGNVALLHMHASAKLGEFRRRQLEEQAIFAVENAAAHVITRALRRWRAKCDMLEKKVESTSMYLALKLSRLRAEERRRKLAPQDSTVDVPPVVRRAWQ